jgi:predicted unusual protein kinase regulating ubiquinone biosynthesis (AarF/ABC1/UbiB family)
LKKKLSKIKSGYFERGLSLTKMTMGASSRVALHGLSHLFSSQERKSSDWQRMLTGQAEKISKELSELKGSLMKVGQMMSVWGEHFLPEEANNFLKSLQSDSLELEWEPIREVIEENLSEEQRANLEIITEALASASLGQVHKAVIRQTGEEIALKVQYPGVEGAIDRDLNALKTILSLMKFIPKGESTDQLFAEIRAMMEQETDYCREAENTEHYANLVRGDRGVSPNDPSVQALSQERRERLAHAFFELFLRELFEWQTVQTDPHMGNYKILIDEEGENDQLVLLDFGAVRIYPDDFVDHLARSISSLMTGDERLFIELATEWGILREKDSVKLKVQMWEFCRTVLEPLLCGDGYDWRASDLPTRLFKDGMSLDWQFRLRTPPRELLFVDRKTVGVYGFMRALGATFSGRELVQRFLDLRCNPKATNLTETLTK